MGSSVGVSLLFTDLVGSTELSTLLGADAADALRRVHFRLLRAPLGRFGGREVKNLGDGIMAVFAGIGSALDAAVAIQQAFHAYNATSDGHPLSVRVGVSTGDCVEEYGDYFGEPVIQAARLCAAAAGGQILAPEVVRFLAPRGRHEFSPIGDLDVKGIPDPVPAVEVGWRPIGSNASVAVTFPDRLGAHHATMFVGREAELDVLRHAWKEVVAGTRRLVLLSGEAGLGKTRLSSEFAREAFEAGAVVLYGRCDEEVVRPYGAWSEAISHYVTRSSEDDLARHDLRALSSLVPTLRTGARTEPAPSGEDEQYVMFAAVSDVLRTVAATRPVLVVLDDLHWADRGSLTLLRYVIGHAVASALMILATYRETDIGADDPLLATLAALRREVGVERVPLTGLSDSEVVSLLEATAGHALPPEGVQLAHVLRAETNGNPFFVREVLLHLVELGAITRRDGEWVAAVNLADVGLPQSVREVVGSRVRRLGEHAHRILGAAAVIGRDFDLGVLANAVGLDDDTVLDALDAAANAGLVADVPGIADRFTFTHALVQHTLYRDLSGSRRARWHARVAQALEALDKDGDGHRAAELATHWFAASRPADVDRAIEYAIRAGDHAAAQFAAADAARWYRAALDANGPVRDERTCSLLVRLGDAQRQAGEPIFRDTLVDAAALARELERGDLLVGAALAFAKENILSLGPVDHERDAVLEEALDVLGDADTSERARLLARLATDLHYRGGTRHIDLARDAVAVARRTGDRAALVEVLGKAWNALLGPDHAEERRRYAEESDALTSDDADLFRRVVVVSNLTRSLLEFGEIEEIRPLHAQYEAVARQLGLPRLRWMAGYRGAMLATLFGELDRAEELAERALALGLEIGVPDAFVAYGGALFWLRHVRGRDHEMIPIVREALEQYADVSSISAALPFLLVHVGETAEARERFAPAVAGLDDVGKGHEWLVTMLLMAETAVLLDDRRAAARLHAAVLPLSHLVCVHSTLCLGAVSHYVGCLAAQLDRPDEAEHYLDHALSMNTRIRAPFFRAQTMVELARVVRKRDAGRARALLDEARTLADTYDFVRIRAAVSA